MVYYIAMQLALSLDFLPSPFNNEGKWNFVTAERNFLQLKFYLLSIYWGDSRNLIGGYHKEKKTSTSNGICLATTRGRVSNFWLELILKSDSVTMAQWNLKSPSHICFVLSWPLLSSDLNECLNQTVCGSGRCVNTEGSYRCNCFQGYKLSPDNVCQGTCQSEAQTDIINVSYQSNSSANTSPRSYYRSLAAPFTVYEKATRS